ncbi:uncharacterized protein ACIBXB_018809 [Morphnus guianensis]
MLHGTPIPVGSRSGKVSQTFLVSLPNAKHSENAPNTNACLVGDGSDYTQGTGGSSPMQGFAGKHPTGCTRPRDHVHCKVCFNPRLSLQKPRCLAWLVESKQDVDLNAKAGQDMTRPKALDALEGFEQQAGITYPCPDARVRGTSQIKWDHRGLQPDLCKHGVHCPSPGTPSLCQPKHAGPGHRDLRLQCRGYSPSSSPHELAPLACIICGLTHALVTSLQNPCRPQERCRLRPLPREPRCSQPALCSHPRLPVTCSYGTDPATKPSRPHPSPSLPESRDPTSPCRRGDFNSIPLIYCLYLLLSVSNVVCLATEKPTRSRSLLPSPWFMAAPEHFPIARPAACVSTLPSSPRQRGSRRLMGQGKRSTCDEGITSQRAGKAVWEFWGFPSLRLPLPPAGLGCTRGYRITTGSCTHGRWERGCCDFGGE